MALKIEPRNVLENMVKGDDAAFALKIAKELGNNTVASHTYAIYDSSGNPVTSNFGGGSIYSDGVITFGVIAHDVGDYTLRFWVTCNETLPDGSTPVEFPVTLKVTIEE
jgi:hypothetical protein